MTERDHAGATSVTALILAGGQSRRFGSDKAIAERPDGVRFLDVVIAAVADSAAEIVILGEKRGTIDGEHSVQWWSDPKPGQGPLAAISQWVSGQPLLASDGYLVIACDYPYASAWSVARLLSLGEGTSGSFDVVLPHAGGYAHPLFAWYSRAGLERLASIGARERSMMKALRRLSTLRLMIPSSSAKPYRNVNRPGELSFAE